MPLSSVPAVDAKVTGTPPNRLPFSSITVAVSVTVPPPAATVPGVALSTTRAAAAAPTLICSSLEVVVEPDEAEPLETLPDVARMVAVPDEPPARNFTVTLPLCVLASTGSNVPRLLEKMTVVPFCAAVPADSMT